MKTGSRAPLYLRPSQVDKLTKTDLADIAARFAMHINPDLERASANEIFEALLAEHKTLAHVRNASKRVVGFINDVKEAP